MTLDAGTKLGPYEIRGAAGAGGMGEVYRAHDSRLGRDVAIKVLPSHLSADPSLRERFEREARAVSSLNHPHICVLHDIGQQDGVDFIVMEYLEGETLADRLSKGAQTPDEVLRYGAQIADALDKAHKSGVVHRDLKPGNVMLTKSGAKLMDFGLARASAPVGGATSGSTQLPTMTQPLTAEGSIVGTFQYMSPEQLEGKDADTRSDIFALGATLYEMATGQRAFSGDSQASLIASIMKEEPRPISELAPLSPPGLDRVAKQCMAKDADERLQSAHDVRLQLQWVAEGGSQAGVPAPASAQRKSREMIAWAVAAVLAIAVAALAIPKWFAQAPSQAATRTTVLAPDDIVINDEPLYTVVSPDGSAIVFLGTDSSGTVQLWLRELDTPDARPIPTTETATLAFWSPDSRHIGFFAGGVLKRIPREGGSAQTICDAPDGRGGAWSPQGFIVFSPVSAGPLFQVAASGGEPTQVTVVDTTREEAGHRFPTFLPDGRRFLYAVVGDDDVETRLGSVDSDESESIIVASSGATYAEPGYLLYARKDALIAHPFDGRAGKIAGEPASIGTIPFSWTNYAGATAVSASANGVIAMRHLRPTRAGLEWLDRNGRSVSAISAPFGDYGEMALSADDRRIAALRSPSDNLYDLWVVHADDGLSTRMTFDLQGANNPSWSYDGEQICFAALRGNSRSLFVMPAGGSEAPELLLELEGAFNSPNCWSRDGRYLLYRSLHPETGEDLWVLPMDGSRQPVPYLRTRSHELDGRISPDGRWVAYRSDESGRSELYVQSFPRPGTKRRISQGGCGANIRTEARPYWRGDGRELFFLDGDGVTMMSVAIEPGEQFRSGTPRRLFMMPPDCSYPIPSADGSRFLVRRLVRSNDRQAIHVTMNWPALLEQE